MESRKQLIESLEKTFNRCLSIVKKKNSDYASQDDPWQNFRWSSIIGIDPPHAIMVRILDKMARINNLLSRPNMVLDENIEDTIEDSINYLAILLAYLQEYKVKNTP